MTCDTFSLVVNSISPIVNVAVFFVLLKTFQAANRQAEAATELTTATKQSIELQKQQTEAAREQQRVARRQVEESLRPILIFQEDSSGTPEVSQAKISNQGAGPALDARWSYRDIRKARDWQIGSGIIGVKEHVTLPYSPEEAMLSGGLVFKYRSLTGGSYQTQFTWVNGVMKADYLDIGS